MFLLFVHIIRFCYRQSMFYF